MLSGVLSLKVCEYLSVRRAFGLVRQATPASGRITFDELGIMCHLANVGAPLRTSEIAEHQGVLRPTMTHRTGHLAELGFIERKMGESDRRSVCCSLSPAGAGEVRGIVASMCRNITSGMPLCRCTPRRMSLVIDECARAQLSSADMVLLALSEGGANAAPRTVSDLVSLLGLLQPTVSMAVSSLERSGLVERREPAGSGAAGVGLTPAGRERASELTERLDAFRVGRARTSGPSVL